MAPSYHKPLQVEVLPLVSRPAQQVPNLFELRLLYRKGGNWQSFFPAYVPETLQEAFSKGDIDELHLETLELNGATMKSLPGQPNFIVLGARLRDGRQIDAVPPVLTRARRHRLISGCLACGLGLTALLWGAYAPVGALLLVAGSHALRTAFGIPYRTYGRGLELD